MQMTDPQPVAMHQWEISPQEVSKLLRHGSDLLLLDCRKPEEHEFARLDGSMLVPMQDLDLHQSELESHKQRPIVVYCHTGRRSLTVTTVLRGQGFENVKSMAGGIERWSLEIDPSIPRYEREEFE